MNVINGLEPTPLASASLRALATWVVIVMAAACVASEEDSRGTDERLELYSLWVNPGEADGLRTLLDLYQRKYPQTAVINAAASGVVSAVSQLQARMGSGFPPDTFQTFGGADLMQWVLSNGRDDSESKLESLDALATSSGIASHLPSALLESVSYKGKIYAVPLGVHRINTIFYNMSIFREIDRKPPSTLAEFYEVAKILKAKGIIPLSIGTNDGQLIASLLFDGLFIARAGLPYRKSYLLGAKAGEAGGEHLTNTLNDIATVLDYTNNDRDALLWPQAAQKIVDGSAAMTLVGDWARGFFQRLGQVPGVDFGEAPLFGTPDIFIYGVDCFNLPKGATDRQAVSNFLDMIGSLEAQNIFNPVKGSTPPRLDADRSVYENDLALQAYDDFRSPAVTLAPGAFGYMKNFDFKKEMALVLRQFAVDRKVGTVRNFFKNRYDLLQ